MTAAAQSSFVEYLAGYIPGFKLTLTQGGKALQCVQEYVSASRTYCACRLLGFACCAWRMHNAVVRFGPRSLHAGFVLQSQCSTL